MKRGNKRESLSRRRGKTPDPAVLVRLATARGALDAKLIKASSVVTAPWVRLKCQFGCDGYGSSLTCPPYSPTPETTRKVLDSYHEALLIHGDASSDVGKIAAELERKAFLAGFYKAFSFGAGPCRLCSICTFKECRFAEKARPSMESAGIDVYATVRANGLPIEVLKDYSCKENYYALVLLG